MFGEILSLGEAMYDAIGPGFFLAVPLPLFLALLVLLAWATVRRLGGSD